MRSQGDGSMAPLSHRGKYREGEISGRREESDGR